MTVGGRELYPVAWTVGRPAIGHHSLRVAMVREAFGVIVRDGDGVRAYLVDGRVVTLTELAAEYPSMADAVATLGQTGFASL